jgi:hypothetical protein
MLFVLLIIGNRRYSRGADQTRKGLKLNKGKSMQTSDFRGERKKSIYCPFHPLSDQSAKENLLNFFTFAIIIKRMQPCFQE